MPGEENQKTLTDFLVVGGAYISLAMVAHIVRVSREHMGERFEWGKFCVGMMSAALVGALTGWTLEALGIKNVEMKAAIVSCTGYVGGPLLDLLYAETLKTVKALISKMGKSLRK